MNGKWESNCPSANCVSIPRLSFLRNRRELLIITTSTANGDNAIVGEIERTDAAPAEPSVEITHEEIAQTSETAVQSNASATNEIETDGDNVAQESEVDATEVDAAEVDAAEVVPQQKRRRKGKHYEEDTTIDEAYASQLDLSCVGGTAISAPSIDNAIISKYNRWVDALNESHVRL